MKLFRLSALLSVSGAIAAGALLFWTSQSVQQAENRLSGLREAVQAETQSIRVLRAEWDYLNRPDRLEDLAGQYLGLSSSAAAFSVGGQVAGLPEVMIPALPQRKPFMTPQPAVMRVPQSPPPPAPLSQADKNSFDDLLQNLGGEGGAP